MQTVVAKHGTPYIWQPLTKREIINLIETDGMVKANIGITLDDLLDGDLEVLNDIASEKLTGTVVLQEIDYKVVDVDDSNIIVIEVSGWVDEDDYDYLSD